MGQRMMQCFHPHPAFEVRRIFDVDSGAIDRARAVAPFAEPSESAAALAHDSDVDLVYVATPPHAHASAGLEAIAAGKALFCEKPLAVDLAEGERLVEAAEAAETASAVNFPFATLAGIDRFAAEVRASGPAHRLEIVFHFSEWPRHWQKSGPWLSGSAEGGFLREVFSHFVFLTHRLIGPLSIHEVDLELDSESGVERQAQLELAVGDLPVFVRGNVGGAAPDRCVWTLYGRERSFRLADWSELWWGTDREWKWVKPERTPGTPGAEQLDALAAALRGEATPLATLREGLEVQRVVEEICQRA